MIYIMVMFMHLILVEVGNPNRQQSIKIQSDINFQQQNDFIVSMFPASKYVVYMQYHNKVFYIYMLYKVVH